ncbi:uncharacterized protein TNCV_4875801 [Trichonephila clavipes]|nr:uncharacterized protein TNCV_4875801 [Trichonephila clavipes]
MIFFFLFKDNLVALNFKYDFWHMTATAGSDVVNLDVNFSMTFPLTFKGPYISNNTANVVFPNGQAFVAYPHRPMTLHSPTENSLAVLNHKILEATLTGPKCEIRRGHQTCLSINRLWHELCDMLRRLVEPQLLDIMIVQFRNEKVSNHGSIPITIDSFADDLAIVSFGLSRKKLEDNTNKILSLVNSKLFELNLSIANHKTVSVVFRCPFIQGRGFRGSTTFRRNPILKIGSNSIHISKSYKYLGVNIDNRLSWTPHINSIKDKILWISSNFYRVSKNFNHQHISLMKLWYTSVVQPIISYGAGVWGGS